MKPKIIFIILLSLFLSSCASMTKHVVGTDLKGKSMLVAIALDGDFVMRKDGITVFESKRTEINTREWMISDAVTLSVEQALSDHYEIKVIDKGRRIEYYDIKPYYWTNFSKISSQKEWLKNTAKEYDCETILVINPSYFKTRDIHSSERGNGIYQTNVLGSKKSKLFYGALAIVYDGATGEEYAWDSMTGTKHVDSWIDIKDDVSISEIDQWKDLLHKVIPEVTISLLGKMKITPQPHNTLR